MGQQGRQVDTQMDRWIKLTSFGTCFQQKHKISMHILCIYIFIFINSIKMVEIILKQHKKI